jgi:cytochrome c
LTKRRYAIWRVALVLTTFPWAAHTAQAQNAAVLERGKAQFGICSACHSTAVDGSHAFGPNLRGVVGRTPGSVAGYKFSKSMAARGGVWDKQSLNVFLEDPAKAVPNNAMPYVGVKDAADRAAVIDYLTTLH